MFADKLILNIGWLYTLFCFYTGNLQITHWSLVAWYKTLVRWDDTQSWCYIKHRYRKLPAFWGKCRSGGLKQRDDTIKQRACGSGNTMVENNKTFVWFNENIVMSCKTRQVAFLEYKLSYKEKVGDSVLISWVDLFSLI